ncbi:hypothetical protein J437_LFUL006861 [Ladona fulva]|uniref:Uncharacterized protein n=1 Tax=Ladona fulva TaxID=123851 RepID=A0A8K0P6C9_LADFU|nr:hypothetical protein J437_LFUL006861 [Ladona fulva]
MSGISLCTFFSNFSRRTVRQRLRQERLDRTAEKVREIKRKQRDAEAWHDWKRSLIRTLTWVAVGAIVGGGIEQKAEADSGKTQLVRSSHNPVHDLSNVFVADWRENNVIW